MPKSVIDVRQLRRSLNMSQTEFADKFGIGLTTLQGWEQGRRSPNGATRVLLNLIARSPDLVEEALR